MTKKKKILEKPFALLSPADVLIPYGEGDNRITGCAFIDTWAGLVVRLRRAPTTQYARRMDLSAAELNTTLRVLSGANAQQWVQHYILISASRLLDKRRKSSEIAQLMNFPNVQDFSDFYLYHTGGRPSGWGWRR